MLEQSIAPRQNRLPYTIQVFFFNFN